MNNLLTMRNLRKCSFEEGKNPQGIIEYIKNLSKSIGNYLFKHEDDDYDEDKQSKFKKINFRKKWIL